VSSSELRVGIIGCGALGAVHAQRLSAIPDLRITAIADPNAGCRERVADLLPGPVIATPDYRELIASGVDAVCIASPDGLHVRQSLDALDAGIHVLCEKPLTLDPNDLRAIISAIERTGLTMTMTYPRRHDPRLQQAREEYRSGRLGGIRSVSLYVSEDWVISNAGTWRHDPILCPGGFIFDSCGHQIDTFLWLTGAQPEWIEARTDNHGTPSAMAAWGASELTGGAPLTFHFSGVGFVWYEQINIICEHAHIAMQRGVPFWNRNGSVEPMEGPGGYQHGDQDFVRLIREGGVNWAPPSDLWPVLNFTRALLESASAGCRVAVPHGRSDP
jgi:predicted dehydrogenase